MAHRVIGRAGTVRLALVLAAVVGLGAGVENVMAGSGDWVCARVTTDKSVDTSTLASIVASVCTKDMSDQEKAIALYEYVRRTMYHYPQRSEAKGKDDLDPLRLINTYGYSFCTQQMMTTVTLWTAAGFKARVVGMPGHGTVEVQYGGAWHWFDLLIGAYVFQRDGKTIASLDDIAKDPTILTKAAQEKRACPTFVPCGNVFVKDSARFCLHDSKYIKDCQDLVDDVTYMATMAGKGEIKDWNPPTTYKPDLFLRCGESIVYLWDNIPGEANCKTLKEGEQPKANVVAAKELPPNHFCGIEAEQKDVANNKYWKPYVKEVNGVKTGRYSANGRQTFAPDFTDEASFKTGYARCSLVSAGWKEGLPRLRTAEAGKPAELVYAFSIPEIYTSAKVTAGFVRQAKEDVCRLYVSRDAGKKWDKIYDAADATGDAPTAEVALKDQVRGCRDFQIYVECQTAGDPAKTGLNALKVEAIFQHNMFARPFLANGANLVTVTVAKPEALKDSKLNVTYTWQQGKDAKTNTQAITESPMKYKIDVAGDELPKMIQLELSVPK